ncbi:MAG: hypothetical protein ACD_52C00080G0003 [uncultured bacterium]|nr:MAG: hypothetical protein ACD_52C00080G0003 [uncultured bacterium]
MLQELSKIFVNLGVILVFFGSVLWLLSKLPFLGKLPGDILIKRENFTVYAPLTTMIIVSVAFSLVLTLIHFLKR